MKKKVKYIHYYFNGKYICKEKLTDVTLKKEVVNGKTRRNKEGRTNS